MFLEKFLGYLTKFLGYLTKKEEKPQKIRGFEPVAGAPEDTKMPVRGTDGSAGYDFYAPCDIKVPAMGFSKLVFFNVKAYMPYDEYLGVLIRSSLATTKAKLMTSQGMCIIDSDYYSNPNNDGNIGIMFYNRDEKSYTIKKGERCCQGIFMKYYAVDDDNALGKRIGGYGSSGK